MPTEDRALALRGILLVPSALSILFLALVICPPLVPSPRLYGAFAAVALGLLTWQMLIFAGASRTGRQLLVEYRPVKSHYIQASVQFCVYVYWGWYWRRVYAEAPLILAQVAFLYVFDALLSWSRGRPWRLGFGPFPIIFSTNFFMWFKDDWFIFQFLMIALGALAKEFIQWERGGRKTHIFNPSAFGLALFSLGLLVTGTSRDTWGLEIATTLAMPHFIYIEIFLMGLVVQAFFGVTLVTLSATATLCVANLIYTHLSGDYVFGDANIPIAVFLGIHLLITDPATSPRTNIGKAIFGLLYAIGIWMTYAFLRRSGLPDFYDKLLVVPVLNLTVLLLDRIAGWEGFRCFGSWEQTFSPRRMNSIFMACWGLLFSIMLRTGFIEAPLPGSDQSGSGTISPLTPSSHTGP